MIMITSHAYQRAKERCGYDKSATERTSLKAFREGIDASNVSNRVVEFNFRCRESGKRCVKAHGRFLYVFEVEGDLIVLITILPLDPESCRIIESMDSRVPDAA